MWSKEEIELENHFLLLYNNDKSDDFGRVRTSLSNFLIENAVELNGNKIITINSNRLSYSFIIGCRSGIKFHEKWVKNIIKYDLWLLEKINLKLKELKINRIAIAWNKSCLFNFTEIPRIYVSAPHNEKWFREIKN